MTCGNNQSLSCLLYIGNIFAYFWSNKWLNQCTWVSDKHDNLGQMGTPVMACVFWDNLIFIIKRDHLDASYPKPCTYQSYIITCQVCQTGFPSPWSRILHWIWAEYFALWFCVVSRCGAGLHNGAGCRTNQLNVEKKYAFTSTEVVGPSFWYIN